MLNSLAAFQTQRLRASYVCSSCLGRTLAGRESLNVWQVQRVSVSREQVRCRVGHLIRAREKHISWSSKTDCLKLHFDLVKNFKRVAQWQRTKNPVVEAVNFRMLKLLTDRMIHHIPPPASKKDMTADYKWTTFSLNNGACEMDWHNKIDYDRNPAEYCRLYQGFVKTIFERILEPKKKLSDGGHHFKAPNMNSFKDAYISLGVDGIDGMLKAYFRVFKLDNRPLPNLMTDLKPDSFYEQFRYPIEWYPDARRMERTWHLHIGPTNSGKTYNALKRLEESRNGVYAGPLRLLAHEVYTRFNNRGIPCNLVTGEEIREAEKDCSLTACTVEMTPLGKDMDVCVLDEIQMINDPDRGSSWTSTLLGVRAKEIHLCGEVRTKNLIQRLARLTKEKLIIHEYQRLGPLQVDTKAITSWDELKPGDAVIGFSRNQLFSLRNQIEKLGKYKCAIVYGNLPAEVRAEQAALFNDPKSGYDIIVASDAIGMGLNLSIRRVVFSMMAKFDGLRVRNLTVPQTLQIAGRAGRYKTASDDTKATRFAKAPERRPDDPPLAENTATEGIRPHGPLPGSGTVGYVTTHLEGKCHKFLKASMQRIADPVETAMLEATATAVLNFAAICPDNIPFSSMLMVLQKTTKVGDLFEFVKSKDLLETAEIFDEVEGLTAHERYVLSLTPVKTRSVRVVAAALGFGKAIARRQLVSIEEVQEVDLEALDDSAAGSVSVVDQLRRLEELHQVFILYMWLYYRFQHIFGSPTTVQELKLACEKMIQDLLTREVRYLTQDQMETLKERREQLFGEKEKRPLPMRMTTQPRGSALNPNKPRLSATQQEMSRMERTDYSELSDTIAYSFMHREVEVDTPTSANTNTTPLEKGSFEDAVMWNTIDSSSKKGAGFRFNPSTFQRRIKPKSSHPEGKAEPFMDANGNVMLRSIVRNTGVPSDDDTATTGEDGVVPVVRDSGDIYLDGVPGRATATATR